METFEEIPKHISEKDMVTNAYFRRNPKRKSWKNGSTGSRYKRRGNTDSAGKAESSSGEIPP